MLTPPDVLIIRRADIISTMTPADYLEAVERAFRASAAGKASAPPPLHLPMVRGAFHAKGASISMERDYAAVKLNGNFPGNPAELGLPTIQGAIVLADGNDGSLLAVLDSIEVTLRRTAAASALAAQALARPDSSTLLICGCGEQGRAHLEALSEVLSLKRVLLWDRDRRASQSIADEWSGRMEIEVVDDLPDAVPMAQVIACCTSAREPYLDAGMVGRGTFVSAVGADNPDKSELTSGLMAQAAIVTDSTAQCLAMGDLHHAIASGLTVESLVRAELAEVLTGATQGRRSPEEIIIFDSTGTGLQDVAAAAAIYQRCAGRGVASVSLAGV
jgi:ornithine cyclodeaminase/alanine dehydrogenase-like protein (mu-crystallin family)